MAHEPENPDKLLDDVTSLDTARMTLRWALERIRGLEGSATETKGLLQQACSSREAALQEFDAYRRSVEDRLAQLAQKERFVTDMQGVLNELFRGEIDVAGFIRRRQELEESHQALEARLRKQLEEAAAAHRKEVEDNRSRLCEMEGVYTETLREAQKAYREQAAALEARHAQDLKAEQQKLEGLKEDALGELKLRSDEYHQKTMLLELEYSSKRKELQKGFDRAKEKLLEELRTGEDHRSQVERRLQEHWLAERVKLEELIAQREARVLEVEETLRRLALESERKAADIASDDASRREELRARYEKLFEAQTQELARVRESASREYEATVSEIRKSCIERDARRSHETLEQSEALRSRYDELIRAAHEEHRKLSELHARELTELHERMHAERAAFETERSGLIQEKSQGLKAQTGEFERSLHDLEKTFLERSQEQLARQTRTLGDIQTHFEADEARRRELAESDLEALRKYYDSILVQQRTDTRKQAESQAMDLQSQRVHGREQAVEHEEALRAERRTHQTELEQVRTAADRASEEALERLRRKHEQVEGEHEADRAEFTRQLGLLQEQAAVRHQHDLEVHAEAVRQLETAHRQGLSSAKEQLLAQEKAALAEREALAARLRDEEGRRAEELRAAHREREKALEAEKAELAHRLDAVRVEEVRKRDQALQELESFFLKSQDQRARDVSEQLESMRRHYRRAMAALRGEIAAPEGPADGPVILPPIPRRRALRLLGWGLTAAAALICAGAWFLWAQGRNYPIPFSHPSALVWEEETLWASDWAEQSVYRMSLTSDGLAVERRYPVPGSHIMGLARAGGAFYAADSWKREIQRWTL